MKLAEIEEMLTNGNVTYETLLLFKTALKRSPKTHRCQHCYTTAAGFKPEHYLQGIELIQYGLDQCCNGWFDKLHAYWNMAILYEKNSNYRLALDAYKQALEAVDDSKQTSYETYLVTEMMRVEMHCSGFNCTDDLMNYYEIAMEADEFHLSFKKNMLYQAIAEMIIHTAQGNISEAKSAYFKAIEIISPDFHSPLTTLLRRHKYNETSDATKMAMSFLEDWKKKNL